MADDQARFSLKYIHIYTHKFMLFEINIPSVSSTKGVAERKGRSLRESGIRWCKTELKS